MSQRGALIGFGAIAHSTHLGALHATGFVVAAVVETSQERCQAARLALPGVRIYHDVDSLLAQEKDLDFVDICTPPHLHFEAAAKAIRAGLHVLCEKPLVLQPEHGAELARLAVQYKVVVTCVHNWIQAPILQKAAALARSNTLGALTHIDMATLRTQPAAAAGDDGNWRVDPRKSGGGILFDHGWHGMSILLRTVGAAPLWVRGVTEKRRYRYLSVEDYGVTEVMFANGVTGRFMATWAATERRNDLSLVCTEGRIEVHNDRLQVLRGEHVEHTQHFGESLAAGGYRPAWTAGVVREFKQEIDEPERRGGSLNEALTALHMVMATYESSREQREVTLSAAPASAMRPVRPQATATTKARVA